MKRIVSLARGPCAAAADRVRRRPLRGRQHPTATTVKVTAKEFKFVLSRKTAPHGKVTFKVTNKGKFKHDFKIAGKKTTMLSRARARP